MIVLFLLPLLPTDHLLEEEEGHWESFSRLNGDAGKKRESSGRGTFSFFLPLFFLLNHLGDTRGPSLRSRGSNF